MTRVWPALFNLPSGYNDNTFPVVGVLIALADKLNLISVSKCVCVVGGVGCVGGYVLGGAVGCVCGGGCVGEAVCVCGVGVGGGCV